MRTESKDAFKLKLIFSGGPKSRAIYMNDQCKEELYITYLPMHQYTMNKFDLLFTNSRIAIKKLPWMGTLKPRYNENFRNAKICQLFRGKYLGFVDRKNICKKDGVISVIMILLYFSMDLLI